MVKKSVGRPPKMNVKIMLKLADLISHNYSVVDACKSARISRDTYYRYMKEEAVFAEKMETAKDNQTKVNYNFRTFM